MVGLLELSLLLIHTGVLVVLSPVIRIHIGLERIIELILWNFLPLFLILPPAEPRLNFRDLILHIGVVRG